MKLALSATFDVSAIAALLANPNAQIREEALDRIVESAEEIEAELGFVIEGELAYDGRDIDLLRANVDFLKQLVDNVNVLG